MIKTAEAVSLGHPDKTADYISSYILDRIIEQDVNARYAVKVMIKDNTVVLGGEISGNVNLTNAKDYVIAALGEIGYDETYCLRWDDNAINPAKIQVINFIGQQSSDISQGVEQNGWGDQGVFVGYACKGVGNISREQYLAKKLCDALYEYALQNINLGIDIKTQITLNELGSIETAVVAIPMLKDVDLTTFIVMSLGEEPENIIANGTGKCTCHSSIADCGVTGRKLACDFYSAAAPIGEHYKTQMLANGHWQATAPSDGLTAGYHLSSLYSPVGWLSWKECVDIFEKTKTNPSLTQGFRNTILGETYEAESDAPEWQRLYEKRETYPIGTIPMGGLFLTAGVDIQKDRIECEVVAWGRNKQSWSVEYFVLDGDTAKPEVWKQLENVLNRDYPHESGITLPIRVMCVDSGYATQDVYSFVRQFSQAVWGGGGAKASQPRTVVAIKGQSRDTAMLLSTSKADTKKKGLKVWNVSDPVIKTKLYRWLKMERVGEDTSCFGQCHFPQYAEEYFKQLTSERQVIKISNGYPKSVWEKDHLRRNEALDCRIYARAGVAIYVLDRMSEKGWQELEALIPSSPEAKPKKKSARFIQMKPTKMDNPWL